MPSSTPAAKAAPEKITAAHIRAGLRKTFPHPDYGIVFEVAHSTGHAAHRHLDAVMMDTWPSRGLIISGIEIKVSRSDFKRELALPEKAEQIARFCDKFYIAAPPDLIAPDDLPHAWGLLEGGQFGVRVKKPAAKTKAQPPTREFMAAIMRASGRSVGQDESALALAEAKDKLVAEHETRVLREAERLSTNNSSDAANWRALLAALGMDDDVTGGALRRWAQGGINEKLIQTIRAVHASGIMEQYNGLAGLHKAVSDFLERLGKSMEALHAPLPDEQRIALEQFAGKRKKL